MTIDLTTDELRDLHALLMQAPNSSGTYPVLLKLVAAANNPLTLTEEVTDDE